MREIKLRAWNKIHNAFWGYLSSVYFETSPQGIYQATFMGGDGSEQTYSGEDLIFMQYTGCKDKKGEEICECDIVRIGIEGKLDVLAICKYGCDASFYLEERNGELYSVQFGGSRVHTFEVIGNIYENPELIKGGNK